jgi:hypothetical protein
MASNSDSADRRREMPGPFLASRSGGEPLGIIIEENGVRFERPQRAQRRLRRRASWLGAAAVGLLVSGSVAWFESGGNGPSSLTERLPPAAGAPTNLPPPNLLRPLTPNEATKENAERPFVVRPDTPAGKFVLHTDADDRTRAVNCLTQAVYYEAASEGVDGGRAVAQVVLNRLHHPGYPSTVCGVVYQGADRPTGCQFTFACDGSLLRTPAPTLWARSRKIAEDALAGKVFAPVGHATHYHADYVLPYWADVLDKTVQIGRHIFYRLRGPLGDARGFSQRYGGAEPQLPKPGAAVVLPATSETAALADTLMNDGNGPAKDVEKPAQAGSPLAIDVVKGSLIADGGAPAAAAPRKPGAAADCKVDDDRTKLTPLGANDMHASAAGSGC